MKKKVLIISIVLCSLLLVSGVSFIIVKNISKNNKKTEIKDVLKEDKVEKVEENKIVLNEEYIFELGDEFPVISDFVDVDAIMKILFDGNEINSNFDKIGNYELIIEYEDIEYKSTILVKDTKVPVLLLNPLTIKVGDTYDINKFVKSIEDYSEYEVFYTDEKMSNYKNVGTYDIEIKVVDLSGNEVVEKTTLIIEKKASTEVNKPTTKPSESTNNNTSSSNTNNNSNNNTSSSNTNNNSNNNTSLNGNSVVNNNQTKPSESKPEVVEPPKVVEVSRELKRTSTQVEKYGVIMELKENYYLVTYSDGSTKKEGYNSYYELVNYSNFRTDTNEMLPEARQISSKYKSTREDMLNCINMYRTEAGVNPLVLDETLSVAATIRSMEIAYTQVSFEHNRPDGRLYSSVIKEVYGNAYTNGENLAAGFSTATGACQAFRNSPGHYSNMINPNYTKVGVGYVDLPFQPLGYRHHWIQLFVG